MTDKFPENIEIEINRNALCKYLRAKWLLIWLGGLGFYGFMFGSIFAFTRIKNCYQNGIQEDLLILARGIGLGLLISTLVAIVIYLIFNHSPASKKAASLQVTVEGAFLRIVYDGYARVDRKLHFRSIVDYSVIEGPLMRRYGLIMLQMTTIGGNPRSTIQIAGLKDCTKVRDMLAEIDSIREKD